MTAILFIFFSFLITSPLGAALVHVFKNSCKSYDIILLFRTIRWLLALLHIRPKIIRRVPEALDHLAPPPHIAPLNSTTPALSLKPSAPATVVSHCSHLRDSEPCHSLCLKTLPINRCKLFHTGWIDNKVLLYSTGNCIQYIQYSVITIMEKNMKRDVYVYN